MRMVDCAGPAAGFAFVPLASPPAPTSVRLGEGSYRGRSEAKTEDGLSEFFNPAAMDASGAIMLKRAGETPAVRELA
jgi:hypothetical protein